MAPLALIANLVTRWCCLHWLNIWTSSGGATCLATLPWIALMTLYVSIELVSSSARGTLVKSQQNLSVIHLETPEPIDGSLGIPDQVKTMWKAGWRILQTKKGKSLSKAGWRQRLVLDRRLWRHGPPRSPTRGGGLPSLPWGHKLQQELSGAAAKPQNQVDPSWSPACDSTVCRRGLAWHPLCDSENEGGWWW